MKIPSDSLVNVHKCPVHSLYERAFIGELILCYHETPFTENPDEEINFLVPPGDVFGWQRSDRSYFVGNYLVPPDNALYLYYDLLAQETPEQLINKWGLQRVGSIDDAVNLHRRLRPDLYNLEGQPLLRVKRRVLVHKGFGRLEAEDCDEEEDY